MIPAIAFIAPRTRHALSGSGVWRGEVDQKHDDSHRRPQIGGHRDQPPLHLRTEKEAGGQRDFRRMECLLPVRERMYRV